MSNIIKKILNKTEARDSENNTTERIKVYTAITGGYDEMRDDIQVFTESDYNRFRDPVMNAKIFKVLAHKFVDSEWSIWIDGNITLHLPPERYVEMVKKKGCEIGVFRHPRRKCIYVEAEICARRNLDDPKVIKAHMDKYRASGWKENAGLAMCGIIIRKHTEKINRLNEKWWSEICRGSKRDQLSFPYVFKDVACYLPKQKRNFDSNKFFTCPDHLKQAAVAAP